MIDNEYDIHTIFHIMHNKAQVGFANHLIYGNQPLYMKTNQCILNTLKSTHCIISRLF